MDRRLLMWHEAVRSSMVRKRFPVPRAAIAATHSIFNIANTLIFLPFLPLFVKLLELDRPVERISRKNRS